MNMQTTTVMAPPAPKTIGQMQLPVAMMRDILIKSIFRMNVNMVSEIARVICLPVQVTQELVDLAGRQLLLEATGTMSASASNEMGYQLTEAGKGNGKSSISNGRLFILPLTAISMIQTACGARLAALTRAMSAANARP